MSCTRNGEVINLSTIIDHAILEVTQIECREIPNRVIGHLVDDYFYSIDAISNISLSNNPFDNYRIHILSLNNFY